MSLAERIAALESESENMKSAFDKMDGHMSEMRKLVYTGLGICVSVNLFAVLWVAFYHH